MVLSDWLALGCFQDQVGSQSRGLVWFVLGWISTVIVWNILNILEKIEKRFKVFEIHSRIISFINLEDFSVLPSYLENRWEIVQNLHVTDINDFYDLAISVYLSFSDYNSWQHRDTCFLFQMESNQFLLFFFHRFFFPNKQRSWYTYILRIVIWVFHKEKIPCHSITENKILV